MENDYCLCSSSVFAKRFGIVSATVLCWQGGCTSSSDVFAEMIGIASSSEPCLQRGWTLPNVIWSIFSKAGHCLWPSVVFADRLDII